jgi:uncharacterized protein (DUF983 family)
MNDAARGCVIFMLLNIGSVVNVNVWYEIKILLVLYKQFLYWYITCLYKSVFCFTIFKSYMYFAMLHDAKT